MLIRSRAPLRLGLAGGGSDVSPFCDIHGGYVLNATIDRYAYATIKTLDEPCVRFISSDLQLNESYDLESWLFPTGSFVLHKAVYKRMIEIHCKGPVALELTTFCDAPAGSGLGSSSTLVVAMIKAFVELFNLPLDDYAIAREAFIVERIDCDLKGGRQDQYSATFGGFNFMEFYGEDRAVINQLRVKSWIVCELEASLLLFYTGVSRESARIISDQSANISSGSHEALDAMHGIKREALVMKEALLKGDLNSMVESVRAGWADKKRSAKSVSNPHIDEIYDAAIAAGASSGKVSGAGGGGFMIFFVLPEKRMDVIRQLSNFAGQISNCHFTKNGSKAWKIL